MQIYGRDIHDTWRNMTTETHTASAVQTMLSCFLYIREGAVREQGPVVVLNIDDVMH